MHGKRRFYCIRRLKRNYQTDHLDHIRSLKGRIKRRFHGPFVETEPTPQVNEERTQPYQKEVTVLFYDTEKVCFYDTEKARTDGFLPANSKHVQS